MKSLVERQLKASQSAMVLHEINGGFLLSSRPSFHRIKWIFFFFCQKNEKGTFFFSLNVKIAPFKRSYCLCGSCNTPLRH